MEETSENKEQAGEKFHDALGDQGKSGENNSPKAYDNDAMVFISMSQELKDEGNKLFQKRDHEGAMLKYEKAINLLPRNHRDVSYLRSNMAACYMQVGLSEYPRAIHECNLALGVTPNYSKALLKRARCYEALNWLDLALKDVSSVLNMEPNNTMASEISERVKQALEKKGLRVNGSVIELPQDYIEPPYAWPSPKKIKEKLLKKKSNKVDVKKEVEKIEDRQAEYKLEEKAEEIIAKKKKNKKAKNKFEEKKAEDKKAKVKEVVEEKIYCKTEDVSQKTVKMVYGEDIRWARLPANCSILQLREVVCERFPSLRAVLVKYRDREGDLVTITSNEELRWAEASAESQGSVRLYIVEVNPEQDPFFEKLKSEKDVYKLGSNNAHENGNVVKGKEMKTSSCIEEWIIHFAQLFKNRVGFESDRYLDLHELGKKLYSEAMEETVTSEEAQDLFDIAGEKFKEMAGFSIVQLWKCSYVQGKEEEAGEKYEEAVKIKAEFYEGFLALGQKQFEQAKLSWYFAVSNNVDLETWPATEVLQLYNNAEDNMEKGTQTWEEWVEQSQSENSKPKYVKTQLQKIGLDGLFKDMLPNETAEQASIVRSHINLLWGTMLYERSIVEFKLGLPVWHECLGAAVEKFELAGASATDIAVMVKNHCSNTTALQGFKIDEIVQTWNEMYEAKQLQYGIPSFRLEPLFRRRVSKLYHALELA
ncbi:Octicosapeptide/Phox/Bem1p domain-containing protein / tetratricopeptide repeat-containing protein [Quillaja saponaria]|uniref:Octicosapeptide/Phox/Bem1p domain-containing protein / tetratricopeptide repeat-containing protein n=1 Tax=Quillaja saponaria TaxID=32244 RepID=A0AAD7QCL6_QUISA|nr:Octicosapeptide/Phox/Bem1p domain-containing protein / tetratricopeptide repeat-containing protein [Quillaja saponaria]